MPVTLYMNLVPPAPRVRTALTRLGGHISDFRELFLMQQAEVIRVVRKQFESEGAYLGSPWASLHPRYAAWKEQHAPGRPIGVLSGEMRDLAEDGALFNFDVDRTRMDVTFRDDLGEVSEYAPIFHEGDWSEHHVQPSRPILGWGRNEEVAFRAKVRAWVRLQARQAGLPVRGV